MSEPAQLSMQRLALLEAQVAELMAWRDAQQSAERGPALAHQDWDLFTEISNAMPAGVPFTVSGLQALTSDHYDLALAISAVAEGKDAGIAIGKCLERLDGRSIGRLCIRRGGKEGGVRLWVIQA